MSIQKQPALLTFAMPECNSSKACYMQERLAAAICLRWALPLASCSSNYQSARTASSVARPSSVLGSNCELPGQWITSSTLLPVPPPRQEPSMNVLATAFKYHSISGLTSTSSFLTTTHSSKLLLKCKSLKAFKFWLAFSGMNAEL